MNTYRHRLQIALAALRRHTSNRSTASQWSTAIAQVIADLEALNLSTERDFLAVGEKLMEFRQTSHQISSEMAHLTELISGEQGQGTKQALEQILNLSQAMGAGIEESGLDLERIRSLAVRLRHAFSGLPQTVSVLRSLCTLTRIETARLGDSSAGFGDLAAEVTPLSQHIQRSGAGILEAASQLDLGVQSAIRQANSLRETQRRELPLLISAVNENIQAFATRQQRACTASAQQTTEYEALCQAIDQLVIHLQFHDITHQQIEHVVAALKQLSLTNRPQARSVLHLQASQLGNSARIFAAAVEAIERDLEGVGTRLQNMAETGRALLGASDDDHSAFFLRMETCFTTILRALAACVRAQEEIQSTLDRIGPFIKAMRTSIEEIRGLEIHIGRIAMNAAIRAVHIGAVGAPLSVVAEEMKRLVAASEGHTEDAAQALTAICDTAQRLCGIEDGPCGADQADGEMRQAILHMQSASEMTFSRVMQIAEMGARLAAAVSALRGSMAVGPLFAGVAGRARDGLEQIAAQIPASDAVVSPELEDVSSRYTMQTERDVHQRLVQGSTDPAADILSDNVELF